MMLKDALERIWAEDTLASPGELVSALDAAGYAIAPKDLLNGLRLCFKNRDRRQVEEALYQQLCAFLAHQ